jgi:L-lactate dehydrogenase (cytochrome)
MRHNLMSAFNISDMQKLANRALPLPIRHYLEGAADDERTLGRNTSVFDDWALMPRSLVDVSKVDSTTSLLGLRTSLPLILSPTGMSQLFHVRGETAVARAAAAENVVYGLSTMATTSIEAVAKSGGDRYFQLYLFRDRALTTAMLERAWASGYVGLCLTTDNVVSGNRERDLRSGMTIPPRFTLGALASFAAHPKWALGTLANRPFQLANVIEHVGGLAPGGINLIDYVNQQFDRAASWKDVEWLRERWPGKLIIKGLVAPDDCEIAVDLGVDAIMISNHGGRQLEVSAAPLDYLPAIRDRVQDRAQLIVDGGVRRGTHVLKALALGADACSIGRPYLYGLAAGGEAGVRRVISIFRAEIERNMALVGKTNISDINVEDVRHLSDFAHRPVKPISQRSRLDAFV